ncbi:ABC transporter substrate-binding protein, partial [Acidobacteriota bacterium]
IEDKTFPTVFIVGKEGTILFGMQGGFSEENIGRLEKQLDKILALGEDRYLKSRSSVKQGNYSIGVSRIMSSPYLDRKQAGFEQALEEGGFIKGKNVVFLFQNAEMDPDRMTGIAKTFIEEKVDLIHCLSITGAYLLLSEVDTIPVVIYTMSADLGEIPTIEGTPSNVTGLIVPGCALQDRWPVEEQLTLYARILPGAKRWGLIYNKESANAKFHIRELRDASKYMGLELVEAPVTEADGVREAAQSLIGGVDAVYIPSDPTPNQAFHEIAEICRKSKIPLFGGKFETTEKGAVAAYDIDYFQMGYQAGKIAVKILEGNEPPSIPIEKAEVFRLIVNTKNAAELALTLSEETKRMAHEIRED